jgi:hypothetical protein
MEERSPGTQQPAIPAGRPAADTRGVDSHDRHAGMEQGVDRGKAAAAEADDAGIGPYLTNQWRVRRPGAVVPDGRCGRQK